nr:PREDICTED: uncharacterized protein LOC102355819 [Latimeria chalumnae]|eukprot:XP_005991829.1 PREDICTED: uncharacterized protein LOC102355819 [Latimeria chalumnae]
MEHFYTSLRNEIQAFKNHVQRCRQAFDLQTLSNTMELLTGNHHGEVDSLEKVKQLAATRNWVEQGMVKVTFNDGSSEVSGYISWFLSYIEYLKSLKETFDCKICIPLWENLYVNEDTDSLDMSMASSTFSYSGSFASLGEFKSWMTRGSAKSNELQDEIPLDSVPRIAKELFAVRRKWALLLSSDIIKEDNFSPQSMVDIQDFGAMKHFIKVLRLVPDTFHKSLITTELATQWVDLHEKKYGFIALPAKRLDDGYQNLMKPKGSTKGLRTLSPLGHHGVSRDSHFSKGAHQPLPRTPVSPSYENGGQVEGISEIRTKLRENQEELMLLLLRAERAKVLEIQFQEAKNRIQSLQDQVEQKKKDMDLLQQKAKQEAWNMVDVKRIDSKYQEMAQHVETLQGHLKLEEYHQKLLQGDWMLELEIRPSLIRQMDMIQEQCRSQEEMLKKVEKSEILDLGCIDSLNGTDSETVSLSSYSSKTAIDMSNDD